jgi:hypothetical protein
VVLDLRAVERALARQLFPLHAAGAQRQAQPSSALSQTSSEPARFSGRSDSLTATSLKPKSS